MFDGLPFLLETTGQECNHMKVLRDNQIAKIVAKKKKKSIQKQSDVQDPMGGPY